MWGCQPSDMRSNRRGVDGRVCQAARRKAPSIVLGVDRLEARLENASRSGAPPPRHFGQEWRSTINRRWTMTGSAKQAIAVLAGATIIVVSVQARQASPNDGGALLEEVRAIRGEL